MLNKCCSLHCGWIIQELLQGEEITEIWDQSLCSHEVPLTHGDAHTDLSDKITELELRQKNSLLWLDNEMPAEINYICSQSAVSQEEMLGPLYKYFK